ncbi:MAG: 2-dehydro-3-deoxygalactonokinase [Halieaceae bacterium]|jgi:2-dehydro-3-deoxygalactonokinase
MAAGPEALKNQLFIAGDWGTTHLKLYLCSSNSANHADILATVNGPGAAATNGAFEDVFFEFAGPWLSDYGKLPVILAGMVGSTIGWQEAPYQDCPLALDQIIAKRQVLRVRGLDVSIIAGLRTENPLGVPDVMRGEELQLLGWSMQGHLPSKSPQLVAMPGTHNKWALLEAGVVSNFLSSLSGELFALLQQHSVLLAGAETPEFDEVEFIAGVEAVRGLGHAQLIHVLFGTRSRQVTGDLASNSAASYLSGLIIGSDAVGAAATFNQMNWPGDTVHLIGEEQLCGAYALALHQLDITTQWHNPQDLALAGFTAIYHHYY